jgi:hypothetical protein
MSCHVAENVANGDDAENVGVDSGHIDLKMDVSGHVGATA